MYVDYYRYSLSIIHRVIKKLKMIKNIPCNFSSKESWKSYIDSKEDSRQNDWDKDTSFIKIKGLILQENIKFSIYMYVEIIASK